MLSVGESRKASLDLFPFISLFLCVIGVLAFLQNLLVLGDVGATEEDSRQAQIFQTAYRIEAMSDRIVLHPPETELPQIYQSLNLEELASLDTMQAARAADIVARGKTLLLAPDLDEVALLQALSEISTLNHLAKEHAIEYEEFVLLSIHSGGSDTYHFLRRLLDLPAFRHIRSGLEIAGNDAPQAPTQ